MVSERSIMCLTINKNAEERVKRLRAKKKTITAYKALAYLGNKWVSLYKNMIYVNGLNVSNRESAKLNCREKGVLWVNEGLHCYVSLRAAKLDGHLYDKIFKVKINTEDIVAFGFFEHSYFPCVVCTKMEVDLDHPIEIEKMGYWERQAMKHKIARSGK